MAHTKWTEEQRRAAGERSRKRWEDPAFRALRSEQASKRRHTDEERRKISESNRGKVMSAESRAKMSAAKKGKKMSDAFKQRQSELHKGKRVSEETKRRMSEAVKERFKDPLRRAAHSIGRRSFWATLSAEERSKIALPGRLACLEATRLREPTSIERAVAEELTARGVSFEQQVIFKYYVADIYLPEHNTVIECDGDYWHSTPQMIAHDKKRDRWFVNHDIKVIRLKECDIRANVRACVNEALKGITC